MTPTISLCMITKNEEKYIEQCLNSVKDIADEIIIVDTGSTDKTLEVVDDICKKFASRGKFFDFKIFDFRWCDDFSAARNFGLQYATKEWILVLDADEIIDEQGKAEIKELIKNEEYDAYLLQQKNYTNNTSIAGFIPESSGLVKEAAGFYVSMICRLFRNNKGYLFKGEVHELVEPSINEKNGRIAAANAAIHHFGNIDNESSKVKKEYYLKLAKVKAKNNPSVASYFELGILYKENDRIKEAEDAFKKCVSINPNHSMALYELAITKEKESKIDDAIDYYTKSLRIKEDTEAFFGLGTCYMKKGMLKEAYRNFIKSLILNPNKYQTYNNLGAIHEKNNNIEQAIQMLEIGIKLNPKNTVGFYNLGVVYDKIGNKEKALDCFEKALGFGHKNEISIDKKIKELREQIESSVKYRYSFKTGG